MKCLPPAPFLSPKASFFWLKCPLSVLSTVTVYVTLCSSNSMYFQNNEKAQHKLSGGKVGLRNVSESINQSKTAGISQLC